MLNNLGEMTNEYSPLVTSIKELMHRNWHIIVNHIYREVNFATDLIANYIVNLLIGLHKLSSPSANVTPICSKKQSPLPETKDLG